MEVTVLLFASLKDLCGPIVKIRVNDSPTSVGTLLQECAAQHPQLARWLPHVAVAVNCEYAGHDRSVAAGDEVAFLPPVSGGGDVSP